VGIIHKAQEMTIESADQPNRAEKAMVYSANMEAKNYPISIKNALQKNNKQLFTRPLSSVLERTDVDIEQEAEDQILKTFQSELNPYKR
jgi:hypothetical protein